MIHKRAKNKVPTILSAVGLNVPTIVGSFEKRLSAF